MQKNTLQSLKLHKNYIEIQTDDLPFRLYFLNDDVIRLRGSFSGEFEEASYTLLQTMWDDAYDKLLTDERTHIKGILPIIKEGDNVTTLDTKNLSVQVYHNPFYIKIYDQNNNLLYSDQPYRNFRKDHLGRVIHESRRFENDSYFGFGETTGELDKAGHLMQLTQRDSVGYDPEYTTSLYKHIPFYIRVNKFINDEVSTQKSIGLFYHNSWDCSFNMGGQISGYWPPYNRYTADGGDFDIFFIHGPDIAQILEHYTALTGRTYLCPTYGLGYHGCSFLYCEAEENCDQSIDQYVQENFKHALLISGFMMASGYTAQEHNLRYVFTWNQKKFPNPNAYFAQMEAYDIPVIPNIKPGILLGHPHYDEYANAQAFIMSQKDEKKPNIDAWWGGWGSYVDFSNPKGREIWTKHMKEELLDKGVRAIWNDNNECEVNDELAICNADGLMRPAGEIKAMQANLMSKTSFDALRQYKPDIRPYVVSRSGFAGIQRYAQTWSGDNYTSWKSLKYNLKTMLNMGLSGNANYGSDVAAICGPRPEQELLIRWFQHGAFMPRMMINSANNDNTTTEPWIYKEAIPYIQKALQLRHRLMPYMYSVLEHSTHTGEPIMRPTFYDFPQDAQCYEDNDEFMFGPNLLVANILEKNVKTRLIYLPKGTSWTDLQTQQRYKGGQTIEIDVNIGSIPMFLRDGGILPTAEPVKSLAQFHPKEQTILISPFKQGKFSLYEDDGNTMEYENGQYLHSHYTLNSNDRFIIFNAEFEGDYQSSYTIIKLQFINKDKNAIAVKLNGKIMKLYPEEEDLVKDGFGWCYNHDKSATIIYLPHQQQDFEIQLDYKRFNLAAFDE